jgi:RNA polymerase sigma factor (sigma-70 family)
MRDAIRNKFVAYSGPLSQEECEALMPDVRDGSPAAIEKLITSITPLITKIIGRYAQRLSPDVFDDLHQHVMLVCITAAPRYTPSICKPGTFFGTTAKFACLSFFTLWRRSLRTASMPVDEHGRELEVEDSNRSALDLVDGQDSIEAIFALLSDRERDVLWGRAEGYTLQEIGEQLGLTRERVRQIEERAKKNVKKTLKRKGPSRA